MAHYGLYMLCCLEGKKFRCIGDEKSLEFKNSGYYVVVPDFDNIEKSVCSYSNLGCQLPIDNVSCPIVKQKCNAKIFLWDEW